MFPVDTHIAISNIRCDMNWYICHNIHFKVVFPSVFQSKEPLLACSLKLPTSGGKSRSKPKGWYCHLNWGTAHKVLCVFYAVACPDIQISDDIWWQQRKHKSTERIVIMNDKASNDDEHIMTQKAAAEQRGLRYLRRSASHVTRGAFTREGGVLQTLRLFYW